MHCQCCQTFWNSVRFYSVLLVVSIQILFVGVEIKLDFCDALPLLCGAGYVRQSTDGMDPFPKRHRLVHNNGGFPKFEALYCSLVIANSTEIS